MQVIKALYSQSTNNDDPIPQPMANEPTPAEAMVTELYLQDEISWTASGRKDTIKLDDGQIVLKHYLLQTIDETYSMYKLKYAEGTNNVK